MSLFVTVEPRDLTHVFLLVPFPLASDLSCVDSESRVDGIFGFFGIPLALPVLLLLILLGFIGRLGILVRSGCGSRCGAFRSLGIIPAIFFYRFLGLDFVRGSVSRPIPSKTTQISYPHVGTWV